MGRFTNSESAAPIRVADRAFQMLCTGPRPPKLRPSDFVAGLPDRLVALDELKTLLLDTATSLDARDALWAEVIRRARTNQDWRLGAIGLAVPMLRSAAGSLTRGFDGDTHEVDAGVLAGFLAHLAVIDIERQGIAARLRWAAWRAGREVVATHCRRSIAEEPAAEIPSEERPGGHVDLVLERAVAASAITERLLRNRTWALSWEISINLSV
jgi:hypothetical protein